MRKLIAIGGGVGPMAGIALHKKIIENTQTDGSDQDHLEVHHFSRSEDILDRTKFLMGEITDNPALGMFRTAMLIDKAAKEVKKRAVVGIPCNTFHAPEIFDEFLRLVAKLDIQVLNMIQETASYIRRHFSGIRKIGLLSTSGTRKVHVYSKVLEPLGFEILELPEDVQEQLQDSIYNRDWGLKAVSPVTKKARENFLKYAQMLIQQNVQAIILGCTEIPLALKENTISGVPLIDPVYILARALIRNVNEDKLVKISKS